MYTFSIRLSKIGALLRRETHSRSLGLSLGSSRAPFGGPILAKTSLLSEVFCSGSVAWSLWVRAPPALSSPILRGDLLQPGSCLALGRSPVAPNGLWFWEMCIFWLGLRFIILVCFCKVGEPPRQEAHCWSLGLPLGGSRAACGALLGRKWRSCRQNRGWGACLQQTTAQAGAIHL